MSISWVTVGTPLPSGPVRVAVTDLGVAAVSFAGETVTGVPGRVGLPDCADEARAQTVVARLADYFQGRSRAPGLPVDWRFTSGPHRVVLQTLLAEVPYGATITYGELARRSGVFDELTEVGGVAARAVGQMMGANPLALLVPCHRVVAADGLGGFGGGPLGIETKRWLLTLEGVLPATLDWNGPDPAVLP
ncbi:methylated-DNA--[protein]-cysteine S-methyltransferase [Kitasatospora sp. MAP5-34]|uniref:methylated-DNA--[protein]-cysteine S-methyltransferase n=1 Tax=Kitasatospora sp. MAP5-34 TaxID=3035102 RepID=UPI002476F01D|nr:methylated-DNA--[protein]-cysteine S-methyltransferase [Kitasatospora sp. MAP5-34]MDH6576711.1 methylated-DNA-[protein]-cysteine S-methyltransferase [Kitasatospora sp. MAP5-34]